jgi:hypothetical protein
MSRLPRLFSTIAAFALTCSSAGAATERLPDAAAYLTGELSHPSMAAAAPYDSAAVLARYGALPLAFEANRGQFNESIDFVARGPGYRVSLTAHEAVVALADPKRLGGEERIIHVRFVGAQQKADVRALGRLPGHTNYFVGKDVSKHVTGIPSYARIRYTDVYPGIDLVYYGKQQELEYDFVVAPGVDPSIIRLSFEGAESVSIGPEGDLLLHTEERVLRMQRPVVYQEIDGRREPVESSYIAAGRSEFSFELAAYDTQKPLVIDPVLSYSTYIGGSSDDIGTAIAVDASGNAYIAGHTRSTDFPVPRGAYDRRLGRSDTDVFSSQAQR